MISSDLNQAAKKIALYKVENEKYPDSINCSSPTVDQICLKASDNKNTFAYYNQGNSYRLSVVSGEKVYRAGPSGSVAVSPKVVVGSGLALHYDANNTSSYTNGAGIWNDISGNGINSPLVNISSQETNGRKELVLDDTSSLLKTPSLTARSVIMVMNLPASPTGSSYLFDARTGLNNGYAYNHSFGTGLTAASVNGMLISNNMSNIPRNRWVVVYLEANSTFTSTINFLSRYSNSERHAGRLGAVLVYNRQLTQEEIFQNIDFYRNTYDIY